MHSVFFPKFIKGIGQELERFINANRGIRPSASGLGTLEGMEPLREPLT